MQGSQIPSFTKKTVHGLYDVHMGDSHLALLISIRKTGVFLKLTYFCKTKTNYTETLQEILIIIEQLHF